MATKRSPPRRMLQRSKSVARAALVDSPLTRQLASALQPLDPPVLVRARLWARIEQRVAGHGARPALPVRSRTAAPPGTRTVRAGGNDWIAIDDKVQIRILRQDIPVGSQTILIRMQPGGVVVPHRHSQEEECFVVEGEIEIGAHRLRAGDMHLAGPGSAHERNLSRSGALLLIRSEIPPRGFSLA